MINKNLQWLTQELTGMEMQVSMIERGVGEDDNVCPNRAEEILQETMEVISKI